MGTLPTFMEALSRSVPTGVRMARAREPLKPVLSPEVSLEDRQVLSSEDRQDLSSEDRQVLSSEDRQDLSSEDRQDLSSEAREDLSPEVRLSPEEVQHISTSLSRESETSRASMASPCNLKETSVCLVYFILVNTTKMFYVNKPLLIKKKKKKKKKKKVLSLIPLL